MAAIPLPHSDIVQNDVYVVRALKAPHYRRLQATSRQIPSPKIRAANRRKPLPIRRRGRVDSWTPIPESRPDAVMHSQMETFEI